MNRQITTPKWILDLKERRKAEIKAELEKLRAAREFAKLPETNKLREIFRERIARDK
jgi:hypothetical protein